MTGPAFIRLADLPPREVVARTPLRWDIVARVDREQYTCDRCQFNHEWEEFEGEFPHGGFVARRECTLLKWHNGHPSECLAYDVFLESEENSGEYCNADPGDEHVE